MSEFKIGDAVEITNVGCNYSTYYVMETKPASTKDLEKGLRGVVVEIEDNTGRIGVERVNGETFIICESGLRKININHNHIEHQEDEYAEDAEDAEDAEAREEHDNIQKRLDYSVGKRDWKVQTVGDEKVASIIGRIENGTYKTEKIKLNLSQIDLRSMGFEINNCYDFLIHSKITNNCDLTYPIIVSIEGQILDGRHRIIKAILNGRKTIDAIQMMDE